MSEKQKTYNQAEVDSLVKQKIVEAINAYRQEAFDEICRSLSNTNNSKCNSNDWLIRSINLAIEKDKTSIPANILKNDRIVKILDLISQNKNTAEKSTVAQAPLINLSELYKGIENLKDNTNKILDKLDSSNHQHNSLNIDLLSTEQRNRSRLSNKIAEMQNIFGSGFQQYSLDKNPYYMDDYNITQCYKQGVYNPEAFQNHIRYLADKFNKGFELADSIIFEKSILDTQIDRLNEFIEKYYKPHNNEEAVKAAEKCIYDLEQEKYIPADNSSEDTSILVGTFTIQQFKLKFFNVLEVNSKRRYGKIAVDIKLGDLTVSIPSILSYKVSYMFNKENIRKLVNTIYYTHRQDDDSFDIMFHTPEISPFMINIQSGVKHWFSMIISNFQKEEYYGIGMPVGNYIKINKLNNYYLIIEDLSDKIKLKYDAAGTITEIQ